MDFSLRSFFVETFDFIGQLVLLVGDEHDLLSENGEFVFLGAVAFIDESRLHFEDGGAKGSEFGVEFGELVGRQRVFGEDVLVVGELGDFLVRFELRVSDLLANGADVGTQSVEYLAGRRLLKQLPDRKTSGRRRIAAGKSREQSQHAPDNLFECEACRTDCFPLPAPF